MRMRRMLFVELRLRMNKYLNVVTLLQNGRKVKRLHFWSSVLISSLLLQPSSWESEVSRLLLLQPHRRICVGQNSYPRNGSLMALCSTSLQQVQTAKWQNDFDCRIAFLSFDHQTRAASGCDESNWYLLLNLVER